ncbi:hypothetical protein BgAZ_209480 [Babesia gibsoni]|uniref:Gamma tubulin complex component C-terminal domain-containing protein n=1 Tax=Babesia gibsoni TaxID=33632 RepID=A0AAD8UT82_BABGI|nr:hypothetical protein BgAZ_209480 [Babesia gibsoni]
MTVEDSLQRGGALNLEQSDLSRSQLLLPNETFSECFVTQKVLLILGGNDGSPVFKRKDRGSVRTQRYTYPTILEVSDGVRIAHVSESAIRDCLDVFTRCGSAAYLMNKLLDVIADHRGLPDGEQNELPLAPSLSVLLKSQRNDVRLGSFCWSWHARNQGLVDALATIWEEWNTIIASMHRMFISSLQKEFCGIEDPPQDGMAAMPLLQFNDDQSHSGSPFIRLFKDYFLQYDERRREKAKNTGGHALLDFKLTLLNLECQLRPFLKMLEGVTNLVEVILCYVDRYSLKVDSVTRVATMLLMIHIRSCEHTQTKYMLELWKFMLQSTITSLNVLSVRYPDTYESIDKSWLYFGGPFYDLVTARAEIDDKSGIDIFKQIELPLTALKDEGDTEYRVLKQLNDGVKSSLNKALLSLRDALHRQHHVAQCLSYLSGVCCLRFGDCLDPLYNLLSRRRVPLNYHARLKELLHDCVVDYSLSHRERPVHELSDHDVSVIDMFDYYVDEECGIPNLSLKLSRDPDGPLKRMLTEDTMHKYNSMLRHMLDFQLFVSDVKSLVALSRRSSGVLCGFYIPRASLPLLHVARSFKDYYEWLVNAAWKEFVARLDGCVGVKDVVELHESYLDFLRDTMLVSTQDEIREASQISPLFSEPIKIIYKCAYELNRLLGHEIDPDLEEVESVKDILLSQIEVLKATLNVVCSFTLPDMPVFGSMEHKMLPEVVKARVYLNTKTCKTLSVLYRLLG